MNSHAISLCSHFLWLSVHDQKMLGDTALQHVLLMSGHNQ